MQAGITRLIGMQTADGGIAMWQGANQATWPWASVYAAHFVVEAEAAGHKVPADFRDRLMAYVRNLLNDATDKPDVVEAQAYACHVLALAGRPERAVMSRLAEIINTVKRPRPDYAPIAPEARFHLAAAWLAAGRRDLAEGLIPAILPLPRNDRQLSGNVGSPVRDQAMVLGTMLSLNPDHPALPALAQRIADAGRPNGWRSTQDAAFAVIALGKYLRQSRSTTPYERLSVSSDGKPLAESDGAKPLAVDPSFTEGPRLEVKIAGAPDAKAYVSWLQTGVPLNPPADEDAGMKIRRRYLDSAGQPLGANLRSGALVQVEITVESLTSLENVVIDDLLPAGLEIENARLQTTADERQVRRVKRREDEARPAEFTHGRLDIRDDRLIAMGSLSRAGSASFTYLARAVTPGTYVVPPVRGECMYDIGLHSLSGGGKTLTIAPVNIHVAASE